MQRSNRVSITTEDGTSTLYIEELKEVYHSRKGALTESQFVYINEGLKYWSKESSNAKCRVLELGYGTGLIAFLTYLNSLEIKKQIDYTSLEAYPISIIQLKELNYDQFFKEKNSIQNFAEFSKSATLVFFSFFHKFNLCKLHFIFQFSS